MRIVENSVVRKNKILDVAEKLFCADGYDIRVLMTFWLNLALHEARFIIILKAKKGGQT